MSASQAESREFESRLPLQFLRKHSHFTRSACSQIFSFYFKRKGGVMDFLELARKRYSVRAYKSDPVEEEKLQKVLEAARLAPTACNLQPFQLLVIHTRGRKAELRHIYRAPWFVKAPILICACGTLSQSWVRRDGVNYCDVDVTIAMDHLILAATSLGLGTCWVAAFNDAAAREVLKLPNNVRPVVFTPLGYPDARPGQKSRKPLEELVRYEHW
jgi:nitroreductase